MGTCQASLCVQCVALVLQANLSVGLSVVASIPRLSQMIRRSSAAGRKLISRTTAVSPLAISRPVTRLDVEVEDSAAVDQSQLPFSITYRSLPYSRWANRLSAYHQVSMLAHAKTSRPSLVFTPRHFQSHRSQAPYVGIWLVGCTSKDIDGHRGC